MVTETQQNAKKKARTSLVFCVGTMFLAALAWGAAGANARTAASNASPCLAGPPEQPLIAAERVITGNKYFTAVNLCCKNGTCYENGLRARVTRPTPRVKPNYWLVRSAGKTCSVQGGPSVGSGPFTVACK